MELRKIECEVTPEINDIGLAVESIIANYKAATADGWQPGTDIPQILMVSMTSLLNAISGLDQVGAEVKEYPVEAIMGALIPIARGVQSLIKKAE